MHKDWQRPQTAAQVAATCTDAEAFGRNLRDWQHELRHVTSRAEFAKRIQDPPRRLADHLDDHGQCDAYLAAYVEWLCNRHKVTPPSWTVEETRSAQKAWYDYPPLWQSSFIQAPACFRRRGIFTIPQDVLQLRSGRPRVSETQKREKAILRQRRYRQRVRDKRAKAPHTFDP